MAFVASCSSIAFVASCSKQLLKTVGLLAVRLDLTKRDEKPEKNVAFLTVRLDLGKLRK